MFLGLDLGTSELKALLLDRQHRVLATARAPLTVQRPQPLWSEQSPAAWWQALETVMDQLQREQPAALAAGLSEASMACARSARGVPPARSISVAV